MKVRTLITHHLVKGQDLNHHGTLFAGRGAEWFVEAGFVAAAALTSPENVVCLKIHGMVFKKPVRKGQIIKYESKVIVVTRTKMVTYIVVSAENDDSCIVEGFITFIHVDSNGVPTPHNLDQIDVVLAKEIELQKKAREL